MKKSLFLVLLAFLSISFAQMPETEDSIYWAPKYCDTAESTFEAHLTQWTWNANVYPPDSIQPSEGMANAFYNEETGEVGLWLVDTYECCCQVASLPGSDSAWSGFWGSPCQEYLDSINFSYMDVEENYFESLDGIYIDMYGRQHILRPNGLSIMYFRCKKNSITYYKF